ncbi:MAG: Gfo/Idh/MocA family oxidoreductase [Gemmatimonadota bacterium]|nr:Gfo/Idh/MocA family oxidoreductase [Gemmatimonadota bacterium]
MQNTTSETSLNISVVGLGRWGPNIVRNLSRHPRAKLVGVCDIEESACARVAELLPAECRQETEASNIFDDPRVQAVVIVTPASTHYELVRQALLAGKHVLSEKPLALTVQENEQLCELAESSGLKLMVGHTFLFNDSVLKMKEIMDSGRLGRLYYATATRTHLGLVRSDVSVLWDLAPHDVAIMNYLFGMEPERVSAVGARVLGSGNEDTAFITLIYPEKIMAQIQVSWIDSNKERLISVIGSKARVAFNDLNMFEPVRIFEKGIGVSGQVAPDYGEFVLLQRDGDIISPRVELREPLGTMVNTFIGVVLDDAENFSDGRFALAVTKILVAAHKSIGTDGAPQDI